jgi:hypothetical protein
MTLYLGNFQNQIDITQILSEIKNSKGDRRVFDGSYFDMTKPGFDIILDNWKKSDYQLSMIEWFNYYSGIHFNKIHSELFGSIFNAEPIKVWISEIRPGKCFPYHWDADYDTKKYIEDKMVRYQMFIEDYKIGHFFVLDDITLVGYKSGDVYKWKDYRVWHAGGNIGFESKFIFNFLGIEK